MRTLTPAQAHALSAAAAPYLVEDDSLDIEACEQLIRAGYVATDASDFMWATDAGRLALRCYEAARHLR